MSRYKNPFLNAMLAFGLVGVGAGTGAYLSTEVPAYTLEYRAYADATWQPWVAEGETAGIIGKPVEAFEVRIVQQNDEPTPTSTPTPTPTQTVTPTPTPTPTPSPIPTDPPGTTKLVFTADTGLESTGQAVLAKIWQTSPTAITNIVGDFAYVPNQERQFCDQVNSRIPGKVAIVSGNHEEIPAPDGDMADYVACLPNEVNAVPYTSSIYGNDYYYDTPNVRVIMISPDVVNVTGTKTYVYGTPEREWLKKVARDGRAAGKWVVTGMHHPCFSIGVHGCKDTVPSVSELLIGLGMDAVFTAHDHNYMRTHHIRGTKASPVVIDNDNAYKRQTETSKGTVFVGIGNGGHNPRTVGSKGTLWASSNGTNSSNGFAYGYGELTATATTLSYRHVSASGAALADTFTMTK